MEIMGVDRPWHTCLQLPKFPGLVRLAVSDSFSDPPKKKPSAQVPGATAPPFVVCLLSFMGRFRLDENLKHLRTLATAVKRYKTMQDVKMSVSSMCLILEVKLPGRQESCVSRRSSAGVLVESE